MSKITRSLIYLILFSAPLIFAVPFPLPQEIPKDASVLAADEEAGHVIAFDASGNNLGAFSPPPSELVASGCSNKLTIEDVKKLPGWGTFEQTAKNYWGGGKYQLIVNPDEYKDSPALICITTDIATVEMSGTPDCREQIIDSESHTTGSSGSVTLTTQQGTSLRQTSTVTQESSIGAGISVSATVGIPEVASVSTEISSSVQFTNSLTKSAESSNDGMQSQAFTLNVPDNSVCHLAVTSKTCQFHGTGKIRVYATGWVWFYFKKSTQGHYKWALPLDSVLQNIDDRSSFMNFETIGNIETKSKAEMACAPA